MKHKQPKLPRGLRRHPKSKFIWFTWRDAEGRQHKKSTETTDPAKALLFKIRFLEEKETREKNGVESPDLTNEPLERAAKLYFEWKIANNSPETVLRERRMFKNVMKFFGPQTPVKYIRLPQIREYQKERRRQISPTMKQPVTARSTAACDSGSRANALCGYVCNLPYRRLAGAFHGCLGHLSSPLCHLACGGCSAFRPRCYLLSPLCHFACRASSCDRRPRLSSLGERAQKVPLRGARIEGYLGDYD